MKFAFKATILVVLATILTSAYATDPVEKDLVSAFSTISDSERGLLESTLDDVYFGNGLPSRYIRHRLVRIDIERFRSQLQKDWESKEAGEVTVGVQIPLFDDLVVSVKVGQFISNDVHGMTAYFGGLASDRTGTGRFSSFFTGNGQLKVVVHTDNASYMIESVRGFDHYIIIALKPIDHAFD